MRFQSVGIEPWGTSVILFVYIAILCNHTYTARYSQRIDQIKLNSDAYPFIRKLSFETLVQPAFLYQFFVFHFPIVKNNLSPTSPRPGLIIPRSSTCLSNPPTHTSTDSLPFSSAARVTPSSLPNTLITTTFFTPHSSSVCMAALAVPPVAITGSKSMAMEGIGDGSGWTDVGRW